MNQKQYHKYLNSPEWKAIREPALERDNYACSICGSKSNLHVHHLHYDNIGEEALSDLVTLCKSCHFQHVDKPELHPEFGEHITLTSPREKYTKVYHRRIPQFTNPTYAAFWFYLTVKLTKDTNIIYTLENKKIRYANSRKDLMKICQAKQSKFYAFLKECLAKNYIAELCISRLYIVNPHYALNGSGIPKELYDLFNKPVEQYQQEYDKDQEEDK